MIQIQHDIFYILSFGLVIFCVQTTQNITKLQYSWVRFICNFFFFYYVCLSLKTSQGVFSLGQFSESVNIMLCGNFIVSI